jgi:hypothetical protein
VKLPVLRHPEKHSGLDEVVAVDQDYVLRLVAGSAGEGLLEEIAVRMLIILGNVEAAINLGSIQGDEPRSVILG